MLDYTPARLPRLLAFFLDMSLLPVFAFAALAIGELLPGDFVFFVLGIVVFSFLAVLYCRDWLLGGRSIGKRLCGLSVVDRATGGPAAGKQLLLKGLCYMVLPFDAFVLLLTGRSVGERISGTAVVRRKVSGPIVPARFWKVAAVAAAAGLLLGGIISFALNAAKENESYALSLNYLTDSISFDGEPTLTGFSSTIHGTKRSHSYTFSTDAGTFTVTCHPDGDGTWTVCEECTDLE